MVETLSDRDTLRRTCFEVLGALPGIVLIGAASSKATTLIGDPDPSHLVLGNSYITAAVVIYETLLGALLLTRPNQTIGRRVGIGTFVAFAFITLSNAITGSISCGCFGKLEVPPSYVFLLDVVMVGILLHGLFLPEKNPGRWSTLARSLVAVVIFATPLSLGWYIFSDGDGVKQYHQFMVLTPEKWLGKPVPNILNLNECLSNFDSSQRQRYMIFSSTRIVHRAICSFANWNVSPEYRLS